MWRYRNTLELDRFAPEDQHQVAEQERRQFQESWAGRAFFFIFWPALFGAIFVVFWVAYTLCESLRIPAGLPRVLTFTAAAVAAYFVARGAGRWVDQAFVRPRLRRRFSHLCNTCGYDLTGNTSGVCPECGRAVASTSASPGDPASPGGEAVGPGGRIGRPHR